MVKSICICSKCGYNFEELKGRGLILCPNCKSIKKISELNVGEK